MEKLRIGSRTKSIRNDLPKSNMIFSEESSRAVHEMGNTELIELRQTSATILCPSCLKHVPEGLNMCQCGVWLRPNQSTMHRIRAALAALKNSYYRTTVILSWGRKSGHNQCQKDHQKSHGCKKRSNEKTRIHLCNGPIAERRNVPSFSIGTRLDWRVGQVPRLHLQDWHQSWSALPTATTIWKHTLHERRWFQQTSRATVWTTRLQTISRCSCQPATKSRQRCTSHSDALEDKTK